MQINSFDAAGVCVLSLAGNMDLEHYTEVARAFGQVMESGQRRIVINLSAVSVISSSGCGAMMRLSQDLTSRGGRLVLASPSRACSEVFEILGLSEFFVVVPTETEAVNQLKAWDGISSGG